MTNNKLIYLGFLSSFCLLTFDSYQPALPAITAYFQTTPALGQLTLSLFFFAFGVAQLFWGPIIDYFGRRKALFSSLYLFIIATVICTFANSIEILIFARIVQGFAACSSNIIAFSTARDVEGNNDRARLLSHLSMIVTASPIFAPLIGSIIFVNFGWRANFVFMGFLAVALFLTSIPFLKESHYWQKTENNVWHFFKYYKEILWHKKLWIGNITVTFTYTCLMIVVVNAAYLIIDNLSYSPQLFAVIFACNGLSIIVGNFVGIGLREYQSLVWNIRFGNALMVAGASLLLLLYYLYGISIVSLSPVLLLTFGLSISNPPTVSLIMADYTQQAATVLAFVNTFRLCMSSLLGGFVAAFQIAYPSLFGISLLSCSLIGLIASLFCKE
ncbi:multidrug resistance protein D [Legionella birminghamensis]|uniref:Multidrug resistance protein D n=1 Tax=Legionella birminghamensis TaxID=28083 RepID=A0A378I9K9_9GAMM|nr:multidrug effflux MFS transporter [Legionella birminghamensis]KTC74392.1 multidrug resistance protein D [Legionella birminghamensis]STX31693.1 multidrug resistance protein D [Legionella birminghamensis]